MSKCIHCKKGKKPTWMYVCKSLSHVFLVHKPCEKLYMKCFMCSEVIIGIMRADGDLNDEKSVKNMKARYKGLHTSKAKSIIKSNQEADMVNRGMMEDYESFGFHESGYRFKDSLNLDEVVKLENEMKLKAKEKFKKAHKAIQKHFGD